MNVIARILMLAMLVVFATGSVVNAVAASAMDLKMVLIDADGAGMTDCPDCESGSDGDMPKACDSSCLQPLLATLDDEVTVRLPKLREGEVLAAPRPSSLSGPPDPYPPRSNAVN